MRNIAHVVLFATGFGGHKDNKAAERFAETVMSKYKDVAVLVFNWPNHGDDVKRRITMDDCRTYLRLVLNHIREDLGVEDICLYAVSFGAYMSLTYIHENGSPFRKMALRSPAINMYESMTDRIMTPAEIKALDKGKDIGVGFDRKINVNQQFLDDVKNNDIQQYDFIDFAEDLLILQGRKDEVIPFEVVEKFADDNIIEFIPYDKADHRFQDYATMGAAIKAMIEFFAI
ncbi:MAG: alpha/beta hydrolase [Lachnospiraceae bacterium]|nr:alpha/beta hydrolase [Candidatus Equihabitans merdae]